MKRYDYNNSLSNNQNFDYNNKINCITTKKKTEFCNKNIYKYLYMVYPNSTLNNSVEIDFLYSCAPPDLKQLFQPLLNPEETKNYRPVNLYDTWRPIWYPYDCFTVNLYNPNNWMAYEDLNKYGDNMFIEGIHSRDDNPYYTVWGLWIYATKGTGVFYNLGKTLQSTNKIHALYLLGLSITDIAALMIDKSYYYNPDFPSLKIIDLAIESFPEKNSLESMIKLINYVITKNDNYEYDRINNTADIDVIIVLLAKSKYYDSVQFQIQANGMGGWCHEVVFVNFDNISKYNEISWSGWEKFSKKMSLNDPDNKLKPKNCTPKLVEDDIVVSCLEQKLCKSSIQNPVFYY